MPEAGFETTAPAPPPDAELIAACAEAIRVEADCQRYCWVTDQHDPRHGTEDTAAATRAYDAASERQEELLEQIADMPSTTLFGHSAKAQAVLAFYGDRLPEEGLPAGNVLASLLRELRGAAV